MTCPNCGGNRIENGVSIGHSSETGDIGPEFKNGLLLGISRMYCDLCLDCGEILRLYIKDQTDKNWNKIKETREREYDRC